MLIALAKIAIIVLNGTIIFRRFGQLNRLKVGGIAAVQFDRLTLVGRIEKDQPDWTDVRLD
jgi:hypothetical protein